MTHPAENLVLLTPSVYSRRRPIADAPRYTFPPRHTLVIWETARGWIGAYALWDALGKLWHADPVVHRGMILPQQPTHFVET